MKFIPLKSMAASDLDRYCLPLSHEKDSRLIGVKFDHVFCFSLIGSTGWPDTDGPPYKAMVQRCESCTVRVRI